jgi:lysophospholipase L1-like esterase
MGNPGYQKLKDKGYFADYKSFLKSLHDKYPATVINYEIPLYEARFFRDDGHLNIKGAKKFTRELKEKYPQIF